MRFKHSYFTSKLSNCSYLIYVQLKPTFILCNDTSVLIAQDSIRIMFNIKLLFASYICFYLDISIQTDTTTLEDADKTTNMEKEGSSGRTGTERLHTSLMTKEKERLSFTIKTEERKTDCTRMEK